MGTGVVREARAETEEGQTRPDVRYPAGRMFITNLWEHPL